MYCPLALLSQTAAEIGIAPFAAELHGVAALDPGHAAGQGQNIVIGHLGDIHEQAPYRSVAGQRGIQILLVSSLGWQDSAKPRRRRSGLCRAGRYRIPVHPGIGEANIGNRLLVDSVGIADIGHVGLVQLARLAVSVLEGIFRDSVCGPVGVAGKQPLLAAQIVVNTAGNLVVVATRGAVA